MGPISLDTNLIMSSMLKRPFPGSGMTADRGGLSGFKNIISFRFRSTGSNQHNRENGLPPLHQPSWPLFHIIVNACLDMVI